MGPAAWAAVGRALAVVAAKEVLAGGGKLVANEIVRAITNNDLEVARAMLTDLAVRNEGLLREFLVRHGDELDPEARKALDDILPDP